MLPSGRRAAHSILIIVQNLPVPLDRRVWMEATSLQQAGYQVAVISPKSKAYKLSRERLAGVDIYRYPMLLEADNSLLGYLIEFVYCWLATLWLAIQAYRRCPFEVIHACNPPDTYFALAALFRPLGVKFVFDHHDLCPELYVAKGKQEHGMVYRMILLLERLTFRSADMIIAVNESHRQVALQRGNVSEAKVVIVRSGPRRQWAEQGRPNAELKRGRKYLIAYLGQMGKQDGVDYLLRSIRDYRSRFPDDTLFTIIGGGPYQSELRHLAAHLQLEGCVHFTGRIPDEQLWSYFSTADLCVDPDPCNQFNTKCTMNKIIEYMAFGKPVVAFDLLEHRRSALEAATYVANNDIVNFSQTMRELLEDEERRRTMGAFAKARFRDVLAWEFSEQGLVSAYDALLTIRPLEQPVSDTA
jgi:glycosyltransferase involved in cell wall biosynthesis